MNCLFCKNKINKDHNIDYFNCNECKAFIRCNRDQLIVEWRFDFSYKNVKYNCHWTRLYNITYIIKTENNDIICELKDQSLTPQNIQNKFPTILTFA